MFLKIHKYPRDTPMSERYMIISFLTQEYHDDIIGI